eukprot:TRINITY_DN11746_c0_g1_i1.p1 TRINITY_DN11746_c0_g1~~TRINITY_DN11746_c0_g1_i1.p1  ORF type:complete len:642 (+),score=82.50 TRINITY_DN11746_c0_g1_i1:117-1928(+)
MEVFDEKRFLADIERELSTPPDRTASPLSRSPPSHEMLKLASAHSLVDKPDLDEEKSPPSEDENEVWGFGNNSYFQLGFEEPEQYPQPSIIDSLRSIERVAQISCGNSFTMILTSTGALYGMGRNNYYQIGHPEPNHYKRPQLVEALKNVHVSQVECGHEHTIALSSEGKVYGFGRNTQFQLANIKSTSQQPHQIQALEGYKVTQIACGSGFTMVVTSAGELFGFGQNSSGQLAYKELAPQATPRLVAAFKDMRVERVACGSVHTMVIANGKLYSFGSDSFGQTGLGTGANANPASVLPTLCTLYISKVVCGAYFTMVLTEDGQVYAFGQNNNGQLGIGSNSNQGVPTVVPIETDVVDLACGYNHALFLSEEGRVYGTGQQSTCFTPEEVLKLRDANANKVASGANHSFAFRSTRGAELMPTSNLVRDIERAFNNPELSDVVFLVEGKKIYANRFFLSMRCEKFRVQFQQGFADAKSQEIIVNDIKYQHYYAFIRFIYTDRADFPLQDTIDILNLATQHYLTRLVRICEKRIKRGIDYQNAAFLYQVAATYQTPHLQKFCLNYMIQHENFDAVIKSDSFAALSKEMILEILSAKPPYSLSTSQ